MTVQQAFDLALQQHQSGRLAEAEALYRQILTAQPDHADALHLLGVIAHQVGRDDLAVESIRQAIALNPRNPAAFSNLGRVCRKAGRPEEAVAAYRQALELEPGNPETHNNLGNALKDQGNLDAAVAAYRRALELRPDYAEAHNNLGAALAGQGRAEQALAAYQRALQCGPDLAAAHYNLGNALKDLDRLEEALVAYQRALHLNPNYPEARNNLGNVLGGQGQWEEAMAAYRQALHLKPDYAEAHNNLGTALAEQGLMDQAFAAHRHALRLKPDSAEVKVSLSLLLLLHDDFEHGWSLYEARSATAQSPKRHWAQPMWDGGSVEGRRVLVHAEQGFGDSIQFVRYAELIAARGGTVVVECQRSLMELFRSANGVREIVAAGDALPPFDLHVPMLSQPFVFQTRRESIPANVPYLFADPERCRAWAERLGGDRSRLRVGLVWASNPKNPHARKRDISLERLAPVFRLEGVDYFSLQMGGGGKDIPRAPGASHLDDHAEQIKDFADTAAFMMQLDLIVSVDTAVAHLAGALGRPIWTLLPFVADWRWGLEGADTPWYPTMRLFRQSLAGDWDAVIQQVTNELGQLARGRA